jgi:hypothetical protein
MSTTTNTTDASKPRPRRKALGDAARAEHAGFARVEDACAWAGIGRSRMYEHAAAGRVRFVKDGCRTLVDMASLRARPLPEATLRPIRP